MSTFRILAVVTSEQAMAATAGIRRTRGLGDDSDQKPIGENSPATGSSHSNRKCSLSGSMSLPVLGHRLGVRIESPSSHVVSELDEMGSSPLTSILHLHKPPGATSSFRSCLGAPYHPRPEKTIGAYAESISIGPELVRNHLAQWRAIVVCSFEHDIIDVHVAAIGVIGGAKGDLK